MNRFTRRISQDIIELHAETVALCEMQAGSESARQQIAVVKQIYADVQRHLDTLLEA